MQPFTTPYLFLSSFPRKRESNFESHSSSLDSRLRGNDDLIDLESIW
jgi:hypothetical protein